MNLRILTREPQPNDPSRVLFLLPSEGEATAEDLAMLQALYSRDPRPIDASVKLLKATDSGDFMNRFYVGYGHSSIAECGSVVIAIENVPMPVAKAIQHYALYRGQESSTRYIDFSVQPFAHFTEEGAAYQEELRAFYMRSMPQVIEHMLEIHQLDKDVPAEYKAAKAAAFDILRGYLPCGALTNLSWTVDLRNLNERLSVLRNSYLPFFPELKYVIEKIQSLMQEVFPNTIVKGEFSEQGFKADGPLSTLEFRYFDESTYLEWQSTIDFASWRDLARHRSVVQSFPILSKILGIENWYVENLPSKLRLEAKELLNRSPSGLVDAYAIPMAYRVPFTISGHIDKFKYIVKQRTAKVVHPTLRNIMIPLGQEINRNGFDLEGDYDLNWTVGSKRGTQDITQK